MKMRPMRSLGIVAISLVVGGCCGFVCPPCPEPPAPVAPPTITGRIHCSDLLAFLRQAVAEAKYPGTTQEWYELIHPLEYQRAVPALTASLYPHYLIFAGEIKKWHPQLPVGWAFDATNQRDLVVLVAGTPGNLVLLLYDPGSRRFVSRPGLQLFLIRI